MQGAIVNFVLIQDFLSIERMIVVAHEIVGHFRHSSVATEAPRRRQEQMEVPVRKLKQDVVTRWNSTLTMLDSLISSSAV